jgi:hypothetical protein
MMPKLRKQPSGSGKKPQPLAPPDIEDIARRGGLDSGTPTFKLGTYRGELTLEKSGRSTQSGVMPALSIGWGKEVWTARQFCKQFDGVTVVDVRERFPNLGFMGDDWLHVNIIEHCQANDHGSVGAEVAFKIQQSVPALAPWPVPGHDSRPFEVQKGELVDKIYEELKKLRRINVTKTLSVRDLRHQNPDFEVWKLIEKLPPEKQANALDHSYKNSEFLFECIGLMMGAGQHTAHGWWKEYRSFTNTSRPRRKS